MRLQAVLLTVSAFCFLSCQQDVLFTSSSANYQADNSLNSSSSFSGENKPTLWRERNPSFQVRVPETKKAAIDIPDIKPPVTEEKPSNLREILFTLKGPEKKSLDVVVVADNSGSMDPYLIELGKHLAPLLTFISDHDWQVVFISANHSAFHHANFDGSDNQDFLRVHDRWQDYPDKQGAFGKLIPLEGASGELLISDGTDEAQTILNPQTPDYENVFFHTVSHSPFIDCKRPPFCQGHYLEQPLRSLKSFMERVEYDNEAALRPGADLISLTITNEDERWGDQDSATTAKDVVETFNKYLKPLDKRFFAFNILAEDESCIVKSQERKIKAKIGPMVGELADITGGFNISICDEDYSEGLQNISKAIETFVEQSVDIKESFQAESLKVEFLNSESIPWRRMDNRLIFEGEPLEDTQIKISYKVLDQQTI